MSSSLIRALLVPLVIVLPVAARAAAVFPGASGVGLDPPPGMTAAKSFNGFQAGPASIVITEMPKAAYAQIDQSRDMFVTRFGAKQADDVEVNGAHGFMVKGTQAAGALHFHKWIVVLGGGDETALVSAQVPDGDKTYSDAAIEAALRSIVFRPRPGLDQQVAALPFAVGDLAGFRISGSALGAALILTDGPKDVDPNQSQAHIVVAANTGPAPTGDRAAFAKAQLQAFQAVRTTDVQSAKVFDADGAQWAQVDAKGSEGQADTPVAISYFMRFDPTGYLTVVCVAPQDAATRYAARFKTVALSVKPKG